MTPSTRLATVLFILAVGALFATLWAAGCFESPTRPATSDPSGPTVAEVRAESAARRAEAAALALLGQTDDGAREAAELRERLAAATSRHAADTSALGRTRRALAEALSAPDTPRDTVVRYVTLSVAASDQALAGCAQRAETAEALATVEARRTIWAYAAVDSALAALASTRFAYREADAGRRLADERAATMTALADRRAAQRNLALGVAGSVAAGCAVASVLLR